MDEDYALLLEIKNNYKGNFPPVITSDGVLRRRFNRKVRLPPDRVKELEKKGWVEMLHFPKLNYKRIKITEKGNAVLSAYLSEIYKPALT